MPLLSLAAKEIGFVFGFRFILGAYIYIYRDIVVRQLWRIRTIYHKYLAFRSILNISPIGPILMKGANNTFFKI